MLHRVLRLALPVASGLAVLAAITVELGYLREGVAVGLLALAFALLSLHLRLDGLERRMAAVGRQGRQRAAALDQLNRRLDRNRDIVRRQTERVRHDVAGVRRHLDQLPSDTAYLHRLVSATADPSVPLPALGGWAATARTVLAIADEIRRAPGPVTVLDCGSGSSTVLDALLLKQRGAGGHVYALEADEQFAEETRGYLRAHGAEQFGIVVDAPLRETTLPDGTSMPWYDLAGLPDIGEIDILFVDGPIGGVVTQARYPAFPLLADRLADGALVVLDDTNRRDEKDIVRRWVEEEHAGRRLTSLRTHGRATLLRVTRS